MSSFADSIDRFFHITERGSTIGTEIRGGIITFLAMAYILVVNPQINGAVPSAAAYGFNALFTSTALAAIISCLLMALYARFPVALAPGMGVNAFLAYTICLGMGFDYPQGLMVVFLSGVMFFLLSISGWRATIVNSIPESMKMAITAGIGFFIALVGLFNSGIVIHGTGSALELGDLSDAGVALGVLCITITLALWFRKSWAAVIVGLFVTWAVGLCMGWAGIHAQSGLIPSFGGNVVSSPDFSLVFAMFTDFHMFESDMAAAFVAAIISLFVVDLFDTTGTLIGVANEANLRNEDGTIDGMDKMLCVDSVATLAGAAVGTSTTTSFIESTTGIAAGARTGMLPLVVGVMFAVALFFAGVFSTFTAACTVGALVVVGIIMLRGIQYIDWSDHVNWGMSFFTIFFMGLSGSITLGISSGIICYTGGMVLTGRAKEVSKTIWVLTVIFVADLLLDNFILPRFL